MIGERGRRRPFLPSCPKFREPEVQHLHPIVRVRRDVRGLQVAMDDALLVGGFKGIRDLPGDPDGFLDGHAGPAEAGHYRCDSRLR